MIKYFYLEIIVIKHITKLAAPSQKTAFFLSNSVLNQETGDDDVSRIEMTDDVIKYIRISKYAHLKKINLSECFLKLHHYSRYH